jgi:CheY-like chemotaxis protein
MMVPEFTRNEMTQNINSIDAGQKHKKRSKLARINLPYAKVLVVDDTITNLDIAKGMMKPYGMRIDTATSGQQAIDAIRDEKVKYNAIFMDHMMPGMDGITAAGKIREIGTDYAKNIPIIALTANAIAGGEKMFLDKGFQAFLTKPIDLNRLDAAIRQWVRDRSMESGEMPADDGQRGKSAGSRNILDYKISGIDMKNTLNRFDGDDELLLYVMRSYAVNTKPLLKKAEDVDIETLADYAITVHGIKGSSLSICAEEVGAKAEALERAAKAGNFNFVTRNNHAFLEAAGKLISDLENMQAAIDGNNINNKKETSYVFLLKRLSDACDKYDMAAVDEVMAELEKYEYDTGEDLVKWLRENVEKLNLTEIVEKISGIA